MTISDKVFWHQYIPAYEAMVFSKLKDPTNIFEFGVLRGDSIRFLTERFPTANIIGGDIIEHQPSWPTSDKISYYQVNQGDRNSVFQLFMKLCKSLKGTFDLIIDDGSHQPHDQVNCLCESFAWVRDGGFYILEDAHTSFPFPDVSPHRSNIFHVLLAIQHLKKTGQRMSEEVADSLSNYSLFHKADVFFLFNQIENLWLYQRTSLPDYCYRCGKDDFNYSTLHCSCGVQLFGDNDSMSFIIKKI